MSVPEITGTPVVGLQAYRLVGSVRSTERLPPREGRVSTTFGKEGVVHVHAFREACFSLKIWLPKNERS
jgi:hypothetical protein